MKTSREKPKIYRSALLQGDGSFGGFNNLYSCHCDKPYVVATRADKEAAKTFPVY